MILWIEIGERQRKVEVLDKTASFRVDGRPIEADIRMLQKGSVSIIHEGRQYSCVLDGDTVVVQGRRVQFAVVDPRSLATQRGATGATGGARAVKAPMPGRVVRVLVAVGDTVEEGQGLVAIEAMKMQNELKSPKAGRVVQVAVEVGAAVAAGAVLVVVE